MINKIIIALLIMLFLTFIFTTKTPTDDYKTWYQCPKGDSVHAVFHKVLSENGFNRTDGPDWDLYLPCNSRYKDKEFDKIGISKPHQAISFVSKNGVLGSKEYLWKMLVNYYGRDKAATIMPISYIFPRDNEMFKREYRSGDIFMLKSERQRQKGLKLSNSYAEIVNSRSEGYKIAQKYVPNSLTYQGHKVNFRIYLVVICGKYRRIGYMYRDGIISYAKNQGSQLSFDDGVASFYTSKERYDQGYPITLNQLKKQKPDWDWFGMFNKFKIRIQEVLEAAGEHLCKNTKCQTNKCFQVFGVDFIVTEDGQIYILEINIGPGMIPYNDSDAKLREELHTDMLAASGVINKEPKQMDQILVF